MINPMMLMQMLGGTNNNPSGGQPDMMKMMSMLGGNGGGDMTSLLSAMNGGMDMAAMMKAINPQKDGSSTPSQGMDMAAMMPMLMQMMNGGGQQPNMSTSGSGQSTEQNMSQQQTPATGTPQAVKPSYSYASPNAASQEQYNVFSTMKNK